MNYYSKKDAHVRSRAEHMYNYFDYDNDRSRVRKRFLEEMDKRTTLKDIGEMLDKFILDEKAESFIYYDPLKEEKIKSAS